MKRTLHLWVWSTLICLGIVAQHTADPVVTQLRRALAANDSQQVHVLEQQLLSAQTAMSALLAAGVLLAQNDRLSDASAVFERCSQQYPSSFEAKYNLALARIGLAEYQSALETLNSVSAKTVDEKAAVEYLTGKVFLATNRSREAQRLLASAYSHRPDQENYALDLALSYIRSAAYVPAIEVLGPSLSVHPESEELMLELALADVLAGRYTDGIDACKRLEQRHPGSSAPRLIAAFSYCSEKDYKACADESSAGLASPQPHPYLYYLRARAAWDAHASDNTHSNARATDNFQTMDDISKAIEKMPDCGVCLQLRSRIFEAAHDDRAAIADLKKALAADARSAQSWYRLSILYRREGMTAQASDALQHYRSIHENEQEVESFRKQFDH